MRLYALMLTTALVAPALAHAETTKSKTMCQTMIDRTANRIPTSSQTSEPAKKLGLTKEQLQATQAALDAARTLKDKDQSGCLTMVNAARKMLSRGDGAAGLGTPLAVIDLKVWEYDPLYKKTWRADALIDQTAYNKKGEEVGEVHDILVSPDGTVNAIIVEGGGFLDIGDSHVRVKWEDVTLREGVDRGVIVPLEKERMTDFSLFDDDEKAAPRDGENLVRLSTMLGQTVRLQNGEVYGYVDDFLVSDGKIKSTLLRPDIGYGISPAPYATPYYAYDYGYSPGYDFYVIPYDRSQLSELKAFDKEKVKGPSNESERKKSTDNKS